MTLTPIVCVRVVCVSVDISVCECRYQCACVRVSVSVCWLSYIRYAYSYVISFQHNLASLIKLLDVCLDVRCVEPDPTR